MTPYVQVYDIRNASLTPLPPLPPTPCSLFLIIPCLSPPLLAKLVKGVWAALENLAATKAAGGGAVSTSGAATSTGKTGKTADMARDLLRLVPLDRVGGSFVVDLLRCYARCQQSRGAGANVTIAVLEVCPPT